MSTLVSPRASGQRAFAVAPARLLVGLVVPIHNESAILEGVLERLRRVASDCSVVVVDGGSTDGSAEIARRFFPTEICPQANRSVQMNLGARLLISKNGADVLLFLHADTRLPDDFLSHLERTLRDSRVAGGCFRLAFDRRSPWLWFYSWCTRFRGRYLHFGDQAFFLRREVFEALGGYRELPFMEDVDFLGRLRRLKGKRSFAVLPVPVITSARRYRRYGAVRQQLLNIILVALFELGIPPRWLYRLYPSVR